jgi:endonuclease/exonuclease/phosphatase family metal-dependent hydrolase
MSQDVRRRVHRVVDGIVHRGLFRPLGAVFAVVVGFCLPLAIPASAEHGVTRVLFGPAQGDALHVMSYNLRFASNTGPHSWSQRRPVLAALLRREQPTILGTQEGLYPQLRDIEHDLPAYYDWIGQGRGGGHRDEFVAVFFDTRRLRPLESGHFWLSDTPDVPGSKSWGNTTVRMATWIHFADRRTGAEFVVLNTHLDNSSEHARLRGAELIRDRVNDIPAALPVILTGDFNTAAEHSAPYRILTSGTGLADTWTAAAQRRTPLIATWHGYGPLVPDGPRIDWILTRGAVAISAAGINTFTDHGRYGSDHLPTQALLTLDHAHPAG